MKISGKEYGGIRMLKTIKTLLAAAALSGTVSANVQAVTVPKIH
jgi:hypothetical protein